MDKECRGNASSLLQTHLFQGFAEVASLASSGVDCNFSHWRCGIDTELLSINEKKGEMKMKEGSWQLQADVIPTCRELGIGIVAYSPLGRGFLTGTIRSVQDLKEKDRRIERFPRFQGDNLEKVQLFNTGIALCLYAQTT